MSIARFALIPAAFLVAAAALADPAADAQQANSACATDATTAGCPDAKIGKGLLKCLYDYKKAHPDSKLAPGCAAASQKVMADAKQQKQQ